MKAVFPLFFIFYLLFLIFPACAQEIPVNVKSNELKYVEGTGRVEASGSVEVDFQGVKIYCDRLLMDRESNVATAAGNVVMVTKDYRSASDTLIYDASTEVSNFSNFKTSLRPGRMKGEMFLTAGKLDDQKKMMKGEQGTVSTCDRSEEHFCTKAQQIELYPDDKIIGRNVTVYVGGTPVFWMPFMFYDLSKKRKQNWVFGHNEVEGDFIKSSWGIPVGLLYLDLMQKKGFGTGIDYDYNLLGLGLGTLYLYHLVEKDTGIEDWITKVNHKKQIDPWTTLTLDQSYSATYLIPSGRKDQTGLDLNLSYQKDARWNLKLGSFDDRVAKLGKYSLSFDQSYQKECANYYFNYDFSRQDPKWIRATQRLSYRAPLWSDRRYFSATINYNNYVTGEGAPGDERLEPQIELTGSEPGYSWVYRSNWYIDLDRDTYKGDENYQYKEKLPEIEISPNALDLKLFTLRPTFGYGYYHEVCYVPQLSGNRDYGTQRYRTGLSADQSVPLPLGTTALINLGLDQYLYAPGDALYAYREKFGFKTDLLNFFRNEMNFNKGLTDGNTPFMFDALGTRYHNWQEQMTFYCRDNFYWATTGGYNWQTHQWMDVLTNFKLNPGSFWNWNVRTGWEIENRRYKDLVNALNLSPFSFLAMQFSAVSDLNVGGIKSGSAVYELYLLEGQPNQWRLKLSQVYDPASQQFKVRDIMVVKDLHCWELNYTYSDLRKEFSLVFSLKALPEEPVGFSTGRGFYVESLEKSLKEMKPAEEVRRY